MPESLESQLKAIDRSAESLDTLYFKPPGVFSNAMLSKPEITTLIRDADHHEEQLYVVNQEGNAKRADGSKSCLDYDEEMYEGNGENTDEPEKPIVSVPNLMMKADETKPDRKMQQILNRLNSNDQNYPLEVLVETARQLCGRYPLGGVEEKLDSYLEKYSQLKTEIKEHEDVMEQQQKSMAVMNIELEDGAVPEPAAPNVTNAQELIALHEKEIQELERELFEKRKSS